MCAVGAILLHRRVESGDDPQNAMHWVEIIDALTEVEEVAVAAAIPRLVAWTLVELNDYRLGTSRVRTITPEARYKAVLVWVQARLRQTQAG